MPTSPALPHSEESYRELLDEQANLKQKVWEPAQNWFLGKNQNQIET